MPTGKAEGFSEYVLASSWYGVYVPSAMPKGALAALDAQFLKGADNATLRRSLEDAGLVARAEGTDALAARGKRKRPTWQPIVQASGISIED